MLEKLGSYRKDIQWINGLAFIFFLTIALLVGGFVRLMAPGSVKPVLVSLFRSTLSQSDAVKNYARTRQGLRALPPKGYFRIPGIPEVGMTADEASKLSAPVFVSKVSNEIAFRIYEGGTSAFVPQDAQSLGPLVNLNRANYNRISGVSDGFWAVAVIFGLIMFIFGRRYGRVFSLGIAILAATILPLSVFALVLKAVSNPSASPQAKLYLELAAGLKPAIKGSLQYTLKFAYLSFLLMFASLVGLAGHLLTANMRKSQEAGKKQRQLERWAKIRQKGRTRYIWLYGVLGWGLPVGFIWAVAMAALKGWHLLPFLLPTALILFPIGGFFVGMMGWKKSEEGFQQMSSSQSDA